MAGDERRNDLHDGELRGPGSFIANPFLYSFAALSLILFLFFQEPRPRIPPNVFYENSRFHFDAPQEPTAPLCTCNAVCSDKSPNLASWKCHSCVKFDAKGKGWFCNKCFNKRHPWYREKHRFVPIAEDDDIEYDLVAQNYRSEVDRTIAGIQGLIKGTKVRGERRRKGLAFSRLVCLFFSASGRLCFPRARQRKVRAFTSASFAASDARPC